MTFLPSALRFSPDAIVPRIMQTKLGAWQPKFVVLHNTAGPTLAEWAAYSQNQRLSQGDNLNAYYRRLGWHSGPHIEVTPDWIYQLCDLTQDGVHASCFNHVSYGVEMVGDFALGKEDWHSGPGAIVRDGAILVLAALHLRFGWDPSDYVYGVKGLHFHKLCAYDHHDCPGAQVDREEVATQVKAKMVALRAIHDPSPLPPVVFTPTPTPMELEVTLPDWPPAGPQLDAMLALACRCYWEWRAMGASEPVAWGMTGNVEAECSFNVLVVGDNNQAHGAYQWHQNRIDAINAGSGIDVTTDPKIENHVKAAFWELTHMEMAAWKLISASTTAAEAATQCAVYYERAGAPMAALRRARLAERLVVWAQANPAFVAAHGAQS